MLMYRNSCLIPILMIFVSAADDEVLVTKEVKETEEMSCDIGDRSVDANNIVGDGKALLKLFQWL